MVQARRYGTRPVCRGIPAQKSFENKALGNTSSRAPSQILVSNRPLAIGHVTTYP